jgi:hypothetical protein
MQAEYDALIANDTWSLVPRPPGVNLVTGKWIFLSQAPCRWFFGSLQGSLGSFGFHTAAWY